MNKTDLIRIRIFREVIDRLRNSVFGSDTINDKPTTYMRENNNVFHYYFTEYWPDHTDYTSEYKKIYNTINTINTISDEECLIIIKEKSYMLAIRSPVNIDSKDSKGLYLDIYNDVKQKILAEAKEEEAAEAAEEAAEAAKAAKAAAVYDVEEAIRIISKENKNTEHDEKAQLKIKNALKIFLNVAEKLKGSKIKYREKDSEIVGAFILYNGANYNINPRDIKLYKRIIQHLNTTKDYLDSGETLNKNNAIDIAQQVRALIPISSSLYNVVLNAVYIDVQNGKLGGKRISKGKSNKVAKKPVVSQTKQSVYKEIFGKQMKIYKMPDSRKEYVKYKGELHPISEYKSLMKQKAMAKSKPKK